MAKNKKKPSKSVRERARRIVKSDAITSVAIVSVLLNVLFLISIIVLTNASTFDHRVYQAAKHRYCHNVDGFEARAKELGSEKAAKEERDRKAKDQLDEEKKKIEQKKKSELEKKLAEQNAAKNAEKEKVQQEKKVNELVTPEKE